jgi:sigma-B regulation protein RsbU (phosphoserine phosphatase)
MNLSTNINALMREQLLDRSRILRAAAAASGVTAELNRLLQEVDNALQRINTGGYGLCEACRDPIEPERLLADPLTRFCLDHLTLAEQRALEADLEMAAKIQRELLPDQMVDLGGWQITSYYKPAGIVSGDYCDLIKAEQGNFYFILGDVSGKGVAASMLMTHLHAMFRTLISLGLPLLQIVERASRLFCESTMSSHFATLVCGRAGRDGEIEICNAGHLPPLLISTENVSCLETSGLPLGMFCDEQFETTRLHFNPGTALLLYTDGLSEAQNQAGVEYGRSRLSDLCSRNLNSSPEKLINACLADLSTFRANAPQIDDLSLLAIRREQ